MRATPEAVDSFLRNMNPSEEHEKKKAHSFTSFIHLSDFHKRFLRIRACLLSGYKVSQNTIRRKANTPPPCVVFEISRASRSDEVGRFSRRSAKEATNAPGNVHTGTCPWMRRHETFSEGFVLNMKGRRKLREGEQWTSRDRRIASRLQFLR